MTLLEIGKTAKEAARKTALLPTDCKNQILLAMADALEREADGILAANAQDLAAAEAKGTAPHMLDRLRLTNDRIAGMAGGMRQVAALPDPVGEIMGGGTRPNGLQISKRRVPMGVVGVIYEARPNVTADTAALCLKAGNACILRGGSEAIGSNKAIVAAMCAAAKEAGLPDGAIQLIEDTSRETAVELMKLNGYVDVLIPRGGAGLIQTVVKTATVPVIETGTGNCHIYVDKDCDVDMAVDIVFNAKTQRPSVCNAAESLLIHADAPEEVYARLDKALHDAGVEIRACERCLAKLPSAVPASEEDYGTEFLGLVISAKMVDSVQEAIAHINRYGTGHSECIVTNNYAAAEDFLNGVDAAAVYVNASTRFTDGEEFGLGAEIGISTQKLHARGPMGLKELTTYQYIVRGSGQIRR